MAPIFTGSRMGFGRVAAVASSGITGYADGYFYARDTTTYSSAYRNFIRDSGNTILTLTANQEWVWSSWVYHPTAAEQSSAIYYMPMLNLERASNNTQVYLWYIQDVNTANPGARMYTSSGGITYGSSSIGTSAQVYDGNWHFHVINNTGSTFAWYMDGSTLMSSTSYSSYGDSAMYVMAGYLGYGPGGQGWAFSEIRTATRMSNTSTIRRPNASTGATGLDSNFTGTNGAGTIYLNAPLGSGWDGTGSQPKSNFIQTPSSGTIDNIGVNKSTSDAGYDYWRTYSNLGKGIPMS